MDGWCFLIIESLWFYVHLLKKKIPPLSFMYLWEIEPWTSSMLVSHVNEFCYWILISVGGLLLYLISRQRSERVGIDIYTVLHLQNSEQTDLFQQRNILSKLYVRLEISLGVVALGSIPSTKQSKTNRIRMKHISYKCCKINVFPLKVEIFNSGTLSAFRLICLMVFIVLRCCIHCE